MAAKKFEAEPDDTYITWRWDSGSLRINQRYYLSFMPKTKRTKLDNMMTRLYAQMEVS